MPYRDEVPGRRPLATRASRGAAALAAGLLFFGCEGDNLFEGGPITGGTPEVVNLIVPAAIRSGDALDVRVEAQSLAAIDEVTIRLRRGVTVDTVILVDPPRGQLTQDATFLIPEDVRDTLIIVQATVRNEAGGVSEVVEDTVRVTDVAAPSVTLSLLPQEGGAGDSIAVLVQAQDNVLLDEVGFLVLTEDGDTVAIVSSPRGSVRRDSTVFFFEIPDTIPASRLQVVGLGRDFQGLEGRSAPASLTVLDEIVNQVEILRPQEGQRFPLDDSVEVVVRAVDRSGIRQVEILGLALRGNPELGTDSVVARFASKTVLFPSMGTDTFPKDTVVRRFLVAVPDTARELVQIIARVTDVAGNTRTDTSNILVGGPRLEILNPASGQTVQANRSLSIRVRAVDGQGITRVRIIVEGAATQTLVRNFSPATDTAVVDTVLLIPAGAQGELRIRAEARNTLDELGESDVVTLAVVQGTVADTIAPELRLELTARQRLELTDSIRVRVTAKDDNGIARIGIAAIGTNNDDVRPLRPRLVTTFAPARTGEVPAEFAFSVASFVDRLVLPDTVVFQVFAFAVDEAGNCSAAGAGEFQRLPCDEVTFPGDTIAASAAGLRAEVVAVTGRTVSLPTGGRIADAQVDVGRSLLYLSNVEQNKLEVLDIAASAFRGGVLVGSQPWGLFPDMSGDTLFVANSGGTNISVVELGGTPREVNERRIFTPNSVLYQIRESIDQGRITLVREFIDFSDRPMFIAQDSRGRLLYSTKPTDAAPNGSIRVVDYDPDPSVPGEQPEVSFLVVGDAIDTGADDYIPIAQVDSLNITACPGSTSDCVVIFDHVPGFPASTIQSDTLLPFAAVADIRDKGSDAYAPGRGRWIPNRVGLSDTTFVAASGNRQHVAFGEGGVAPFARLIIWHSERNGGEGGLSSPVEVIDIVNNASETVQGVGLNQTGDLGVARGTQGAYFFTGGEDPIGDLRLQGVFTEGLQGGGAGAAFHPLHDNARDADETSVAFVGTNRRSVKAVNTFHFFEMGEIFIRDNLAGPLRASLPLPSDNVGVSCPGPACVVLKLYGVTDSGGVVIIDVRRGDLDTAP